VNGAAGRQAVSAHRNSKRHSAGRFVPLSGDFMIELALTCLIGLIGSATLVGFWMLRAVRPRLALHRER